MCVRMLMQAQKKKTAAPDTTGAGRGGAPLGLLSLQIGALVSGGPRTPCAVALRLIYEKRARNIVEGPRGVSLGRARPA